MKKLPIVILLFAILFTACSGVNDPISTSVPTATGAPTTAPIVNPTVTLLPIPNPTTCLEKITANTMVPFTVDTNMDVGDGSLTSLVYAQDATGSSFAAIIEKGYSLDFESAKISGKFLQTDTGMADVVCAANELAANANTTAKLYVGAGMTPDGWTKDYPAGWKMFSWTYQDKPIEVKGANWATSNIALTDKIHEYGSSDGMTYCQLWDGADAGKVYHVIVENGGHKVTSPAMQGTCWVVTGTYDHDELLRRFAQMTDEVILRDDHPVVIHIYAGKSAPTNWNDSVPDGWKIIKP